MKRIYTTFIAMVLICSSFNMGFSKDEKALSRKKVVGSPDTPRVLSTLAPETPSEVQSGIDGPLDSQMGLVSPESEEETDAVGSEGPVEIVGRDQSKAKQSGKAIPGKGGITTPEEKGGIIGPCN